MYAQSFFVSSGRESGVEPTTGVPVRGFNYVAVVGRQVIQLASQDFETHAATLPRAEAAALTFRKP